MAKKKVNVELNMTPFIGLFALLVVMLLLTAVWNHVMVLSTDTSSTSASDQVLPSAGPQVTLNVTILTNKLEMAVNDKGVNIPHINGRVDLMRMVAVLNQWRQRYPKKTDVILNTENAVNYNMLIEVFDTLVGNSWPDVGINTQ